MTKDEVLKLALEALETGGWNKTTAAITAIKEALAQPEQEQDRQIDQLIQERDHRDEIIDKLCDAVLGPDRYEWSSQYFFEDAVREVEERMAALEAQPEQDYRAMYLKVRDELAELQQNQPHRKPLTDEEIEDLYFDKFSMGELKAFARAIEAKLKEKNT